MSELASFAAEFAAALNQQLDESLPYQPYEGSGLDEALIEEAALAAKVRWEHLWSVLDAEKVAGATSRTLRASNFYSEVYPGEFHVRDRALLMAERLGDMQKNPKVLRDHGSVEAAAAKDLQFSAEYPFTARTAIIFCSQQGLSERQAGRYIEAAHAFTASLIEQGNIGTDELLRDPMFNLGNAIIAVLMPEQESALKAEWESYLNEAIGDENLIGDDGSAMEDMTMNLLAWVNNRLLERIRTGSFPPIVAYEENWDEEGFRGKFAAYGSDAPYFEGVRQQREQQEAIQAAEAMK